MSFKETIDKYANYLTSLSQIFGKDELTVKYDRLKNEPKVKYELLYFAIKQKEVEGVFVFGFEHYLYEYTQQEMKRTLGHNSINLSIFMAYHRLSRKSRQSIRVSDLAKEAAVNSEDTLLIHKFITRICTLAYYLGWKLTPDTKDLEGDYFVEIPERFLLKLKQRFTFDMSVPMYENAKLFMFLNSKNKIVCVLKDKDEFSISDIEKILFPTLKSLFQVKDVVSEK
ncbi:hypothetical protein H6501_01940 [Candidatus Woesearchaeota archaeon]|nr:hypothetical protein [Nanoarchaeota archaeon]MCB9370337.1 hypothetical protein [Candidatus Woesearchaeota archaeon]USN44859.1 MAG: hypothetical protein H6500_03385 [Candidatus Woesearchaeota archaeon]